MVTPASRNVPRKRWARSVVSAASAQSTKKIEAARRAQLSRASVSKTRSASACSAQKYQ
jgi:hypothetical protein